MRLILMCLTAAALTAGCCNKIKEDAESLVADHERCSAGDTCIIVRYYEAVGPNNCLGPFQCSGALNEKNIGSFYKDAKELASDFEHCNECTMADCAVVDETTHSAMCNPDTGRCEIVWGNL